MSDHWLWALVPLGVVCAIVSVVMILRLIDLHRGDALASLPLLAEQDFPIDATGPMLLHGEGPRFTRAFASLDYALTDLSDGRVVVLGPVWLKSSSSGFSRARLSLRAFELARPGRYRLTVLGLTDPAVADQHRVVIGHDRRGRMVGIIVALVFSAIGFVASLALSLIIWIINRGET